MVATAVLFQSALITTGTFVLLTMFQIVYEGVLLPQPHAEEVRENHCSCNCYDVHRGATGADDVDESCGELPPIDTILIKHPERMMNVTEQHEVANIYVSYDSQRVFLSQLDGSVFDQNSRIFMFYDGPGAAMRTRFVKFQLDNEEPRVSRPGGPHDFVGIVSKTNVHVTFY